CFKYKILPGVGMSYYWVHKKEHRFRLSGNLMYDATKFVSSDLHLLGKTNDFTRTVFRPTLFFVGKHSFLTGNINVSYEGWLQTAFNDTDDFRAQINLNLDERIYKQLFVRAQLFYFYETVLPITKKQHDLRLTFGVVWKRG
ncbi:MAG: DUF481 domain-containing protein, partial [Bacteroidota bacterium]